jgi:aspartyl-tRNA(Asn)/glutamyl-tRNA(Gln) amidotransferase subunit B
LRAKSTDVASFEPVIGLEVHAQLLTQSKLFCGCPVEVGREANTCVCPVCLGLPGALPVLNEAALRLAARAALALDLDIHQESIFARKNYFYPDLPKGYQISQFEEPYSQHGHLDFELDGQWKRAGITRIHMEEDAGKNLHGRGHDSAVDLNRAGTPLIEIVGDPDLRSSAEAAAYLRTLREILMFLGVNDGNLEEGSFRCDANVSIRKVGETKLGTRVELKNINSFRFVQKAIDVEIARQKVLLESGQAIAQETRGYDSEQNRTYSLRSKEEAHDYRYFPDPDLPLVRITDELLAEERDRLPELPRAVRTRWLAEGLAESAVATLTGHPAYVRFVEAVRAGSRGGQDGPSLTKIANFVQTEVLRGAVPSGLNVEFSVTPEQVGCILALVHAGRISGKQAKELLALVEGSGQDPADVVKERGMEVVSDSSALEATLERLLLANPKQAEGLRAGKQQLAGFFVGQVMKETGGAADPKLVAELLAKLSRS